MEEVIKPATEYGEDRYEATLTIKDPADDYFDSDPVPALFELDCQSTETRAEFRVVSVCHECFHKLMPDMWISSGMWKDLNPITPFEQLPLLEETHGTTGKVQ